ncbi:MAG: A24 family peptidase [Pseudomonadota bacterium]
MAELFELVPWLFYVAVTTVSLLVGSFLNVVIYRLPIMMEREWDAQNIAWQAERAARDWDTPANVASSDSENSDEPQTLPVFNLATPRSACPVCERPIRAVENIPILSYLALGGKCAGCKTRISIRYPAVELLTAVLSLCVALRFGIGWETVVGVGLTWTLVALSGIDIDKQLLPDSITLPLLWTGLALSLLHGQVEASVLFIAPADAVLGAIFGYLAFWSVYQLFKLTTGKEGMGYGDFKLLSALGAWLGWQMLPVIILLSAAVGALFGIAMMLLRRQQQGQPMPFGPWIAAAGYIAMLHGEDLIQWYLSLSGLA